MIEDLSHAYNREAHAEAHEAPHVGHQLQVGHHLVTKKDRNEWLLNEHNHPGKVVSTVDHQCLSKLLLLSIGHPKFRLKFGKA